MYDSRQSEIFVCLCHVVVADSPRLPSSCQPGCGLEIADADLAVSSADAHRSPRVQGRLASIGRLDLAAARPDGTELYVVVITNVSARVEVLPVYFV